MYLYLSHKDRDLSHLLPQGHLQKRCTLQCMDMQDMVQDKVQDMVQDKVQVTNFLLPQRLGSSMFLRDTPSLHLQFQDSLVLYQDRECSLHLQGKV